MSWFSVDVEADGPCPGRGSMLRIGAVRVDDRLQTQFYGELRPVFDEWDREAILHAGIVAEDGDPDEARAIALGYPDPRFTMARLDSWLRAESRGRPVMVSDNLVFDGQYVNWYFWHLLGRNLLGISGRRIGDLHSGLVRDPFAKWKHLRKTKHSHHPVDDALGNAEALLAMRDTLGLVIPR